MYLKGFFLFVLQLLHLKFIIHRLLFATTSQLGNNSSIDRISNVQLVTTTEKKVGFIKLKVMAAYTYFVLKKISYRFT